MTEHNSPFSFHCMICFDSFNPEDRYPVVLPCGHTYVCNECAERLDKCMECRTLLYTREPMEIDPKTSPQHQHLRSSTSGYGRAGVHPAPTARPTIKKRLPLPKNVVLLSLMEATELVSRDVNQKFSNSPRPSDVSEELPQPSILDGNPSSGSTDWEDNSKIYTGTMLAAGTSGTYAVAHREGLDIFTRKPQAVQPGSDEDIDTLVGLSKEEKRDADSTTPQPMAKLSYGDRIQVVSIEGSWAKLSRGYGYVQAGNNNIVKVAGAVDRACKLEALLRALSSRRKELRIEQSDVDTRFIHLMKDLQETLQRDEDLTVVCGKTLADYQQEEKIPKMNSIEEANDDGVNNDWPIKPRMRQAEEVETVDSGLMCFAGTCNSGDDGPNLLPTFSSNGSPRSRSLFSAFNNPSTRLMREGARAWRERNLESVPSSVDFKTGLSGHTALSSQSHPHSYLDPERTPRRHAKMRMSSHAGLSSSGTSPFKIFESLFPSFVISPRPTENNNQRIHRADSV